jgi:hypothetical protein
MNLVKKYRINTCIDQKYLTQNYGGDYITEQENDRGIRRQRDRLTGKIRSQQSTIKWHLTSGN